MGRSQESKALTAAIGVLFALTVVAGGAPLFAQIVQVDVPSEDAAKSLLEFARQANVQVIGPGKPLVGIITPEIKGTFDAIAALEMMLKGTDLKVSRTVEGVITISSKKMNCIDEGETMLSNPRNSASVIALLFGALATPACTAQPAPASTSDAESMETVVVTGTRTGTNIADIAPVGSASVTLDREKIDALGMTSIIDVVSTVPAAGAEVREGVLNQSGVTSINLRGLGSAATTLILVNGRRVAPTGASGTTVSAAQLPLAMVDRVEMLVDGASAIYGSDAIAGVVNFVTRRNFEGVQVAPRYTYNNDYSEWGGALTAGMLWESLGKLGKGNIIIGYDYAQRTSFISGTQPLLRKDQRPLGGLDHRVTGQSLTPMIGTPIAIVNLYDTYNYYTVAPGVSGSAVPTMAQLTRVTNTDDLPIIDQSYFQYQYPRSWRHQIVAVLNQDITPWLNVFYEGFFTKRQSTSISLSSYADTTDYKIDIAGFMRIPVSTTPWAISALVPASVGSGTLQQSVTRTFGVTHPETPEDSMNQTIGFNAKLPFGWNAAGYFTWALDTTCSSCVDNGNVDTGAYETLVANGTINPYFTGTLPQMSQITGPSYAYGRNMIDNFVLKFDGPLFDLPGGTVKAAVGGGYLYATEHYKAGSNQSPGYVSGMQTPRTAINQFAWDSDTGLNRSIASFYAEAYVPLVGEEMHVPLIKSFIVDAAFRYDSYSDTGNTTNPKVGATLVVDDQFQIRGSWGTSFRAPDLTSLNPYVSSSHGIMPGSYGILRNNSGDPFYGVPGAGITVLNVMGNSNTLKPETSENWSVGFDYKANWLNGLHLSATYYSLVYANQISAMWGAFGAFASAKDYALYGPWIHKVNDNAGCDANNPATWGATLNHWINEVPAITGTIEKTYICQVQAVMDMRTTNIASTKQRGIDVSIDYLFPTDRYGLFTLNLSVNTILDNTYQGAPGAPHLQNLNRLQSPVRWRGRSGIGWIMNPISATIFVNYIGNGVNDDALLPSQAKVPGLFTVDLNVSYKLDKESGGEELDGTVLSVGVQNLFDQNPPISLQKSGLYGAFDTGRYNAIGRVINFQLTKQFN